MIAVAEPKPSWIATLQAQRVAVFRALQLGDMLCAVPALRALRDALPEAEISLIGLPWAHAFAQRFRRYIDDFIAFPGHAGLPEQAPPHPDAFAGFLTAVRARYFDLAVQLHGDGCQTNALVAQLGARWRAGFVSPRSAPMHLGLPYAKRGSEVERLLALMQALGAQSCDTRLEFPLSAADEIELQRAAIPAIPERYICLHPGARDAAKRWPPQCFAAVGDALQARFGLPVILTGSGPERHLTAAVAAAMHTPALNAAGDYSIGALAALIGRATLLVCNDTGVSHLAAATRTPSVVVFICTDQERWAPLDTDLHRSVRDASACNAACNVDAVLAHCRILIARARPGGETATAPRPGQ